LGNGIRKNTSLKTLLIKSNFIGDIGALALANGLANGAVAVSKLDLSSNKITDQGGMALVQGLKLNNNLLNLNLKANFIVKFLSICL
jgi:Ran GTPase-activating protein (RanGAP) involved in mRNA processing and transport